MNEKSSPVGFFSSVHPEKIGRKITRMIMEKRPNSSFVRLIVQVNP
jgi:hypothetical protein